MPAAFVGIATLDVIQRVRQPPRWGRKSVAESVEVAAGGPASNAAVTCARLSGSANLITGIGSGAIAELVRADLRDHHVTVSDCAPQDRAWALPVATAILHADGERTVVSTGATRTDLSADDALALTAQAYEVVRTAPLLLLDGHHPSLAQAALEISPSDQVTILDAGSAKPHAEAWLARIDILAASADYATGLGLTPDQTLTHGLDAGCRAVVVTGGAGPTRWATANGGSGAVSPPQVRALDTLGAGDAFHGALAAELASAGPQWLDRLDDAVRRAVEVAAVRVAHVGARGWLWQL